MARKLTRASGAVALAIALGVTACGGGGAEGGQNDGTSDAAATGGEATGESAQGGDLVIGGVPASIDPVQTTQKVVGIVAGSVCEGLFENTANLGYGEGLIDTWSYDEDVTYVFDLREGVNFHDGTVLTAEDAVASLARFAASAPGATFGSLVESIDATGDLQVTLTLNRPSGAVPALLATPDSAAYVMPASIVAEQDPSDALQHLTCTGPYKMDSYAPDQEIKLSRFDDYTGRAEASDGATGEKVAIVDTISFTPSDNSNVLNLLRTGAIHVQSQLAVDLVGGVEDDPDVNLVKIDDSGFPLLQFNTTNGPLSDQILRQAVLAAMDAEQVMAAAAPSADYYTLDSSLMPPDSPWHSTAGAEYYNQADPERSKQLQEQAGYDGEPLRLIYQSGDAWAPVAIAQIESAGFTVDAQMTDGPTFTQRRSDPEQWDMFISGGSRYGDPLTVVFMSAGFPGWWDTPEKHALMDQLLSGTTQEERLETWNELQGLIWEQVPFIRFGGRAQVDAISPSLGEYPPFPGSARGFYNVAFTSE